MKQIKDTGLQMGTVDFDLSFGPLARYERADEHMLMRMNGHALTQLSSGVASTLQVPIIEYPTEKKRSKKSEL